MDFLRFLEYTQYELLARQPTRAGASRRSARVDRQLKKGDESWRQSACPTLGAGVIIISLSLILFIASGS